MSSTQTARIMSQHIKIRTVFSVEGGNVRYRMIYPHLEDILKQSLEEAVPSVVRMIFDEASWAYRNQRSKDITASIHTITSKWNDDLGEKFLPFCKVELSTEIGTVDQGPGVQSISLRNSAITFSTLVSQNGLQHSAKVFVAIPKTNGSSDIGEKLSKALNELPATIARHGDDSESLEEAFEDLVQGWTGSVTQYIDYNSILSIVPKELAKKLTLHMGMSFSLQDIACIS